MSTEQPNERRLQRLARHLRLVGSVVSDDRPPAEERLVAILGAEQLQAVRAELEERGPKAARVPILRPHEWEAVRALARLRNWQRSVFLAALACGAAIAIVGLIDLIWDVRALLGGVGAVALVVYVFLLTRHSRTEERWIGS
jgi:hypothetical protein